MHCDSINNYLDAKFGYGFAFDEINIKKKKSEMFNLFSRKSSNHLKYNKATAKKRKNIYIGGDLHLMYAHFHVML